MPLRHTSPSCSPIFPERAAVVKKLNVADVPIVAIPLLPYEEGYYFTPDNATRAAERYEVWMQYNSFVPTLGPGMLWSYGPEAQALAVDTTGGGPDVSGHPQFSPLS